MIQDTVVGKDQIMRDLFGRSTPVQQQPQGIQTPPAPQLQQAAPDLSQKVTPEALPPKDSPGHAFIVQENVNKSAGEIAKEANKFLEDVNPRATSEQKARAFVEAQKVLDGNQPSEGALRAREAFKDPEAQKNADAVIQNEESAGGDVVESMGGLLSLVLPVLAGAAIGGGRGAAAAAVGAGEHYLEEDKAKKDSAREEAKADRASKRDFEEAKQLEEIQQAGAMGRAELAQMGKKTPEEEAQAEGDKALVRGRANNLLRAEEDQQTAQGFLRVGEDILGRFGKATKGKGWARFQLERKFSTTELGQLQSEVNGLVFDIVKAKQGSRPSDFDVQALMKIVNGDWTADPAVAYKLLKQTLENSEKFINARVEAARAAYEKKELSKETSDTLREADKARLIQQELRGLGESRVKGLMELSRKHRGASASDVQKQLSARGIVVSEDLLRGFGFK